MKTARIMVTNTTKMARVRELLEGETLLTVYLESLAKAEILVERLASDDANSPEAKHYKNLMSLADEIQVEIAEGTPNFSNKVTDAIVKRYPMLPLSAEVLQGAYWRDDDKDLLSKQEVFADYVKLIESSPRDE